MEHSYCFLGKLRMSEIKRGDVKIICSKMFWKGSIKGVIGLISRKERIQAEKFSFSIKLKDFGRSMVFGFFGVS